MIPVKEFGNVELDGCFIGACTTAEEDILLGALVLEQGLTGVKAGPEGKEESRSRVTTHPATTARAQLCSSL